MNRVCVGAVVGALLLLGGCAGAPDSEPTVAPPSLGVVPEQDRTPEPSPTPTGVSLAPSPTPIPGTKLYPGSTPGTVQGEGGRLVRFVPADPAQSFECRPLTDAERFRAENSDSGQSPVWSRRSAAIDLSEESFAVVAYWHRDFDGKVVPMGLVTGGGRFSNLYPGWRGSHTLAGVAFADGPEVFDAALACIGAPPQ